MKRKITELLDDEGAVSPVIGVILMVAITVILAAVIGTFVLGLGDQVSQTAPQSTITVEDTDLATATINLSHGGGDPIVGGETAIVVQQGGSSVEFTEGSGELTTAESITIYINSSTPSAEEAILGGFTYSPQDYGGSLNALGANTDVTVTFVDDPSGQIIAEKEINA